jgi:hypothetical protein
MVLVLRCSCLARTARRRSGKIWRVRARSESNQRAANLFLRAIRNARLADIDNWVTEGFDTADPKDAKALLDELSKSN